MVLNSTIEDRVTAAYDKEYRGELRSLQEFFSSLNNFKNFIHSTTAKLANYPILLLDGEQGVGKSHLIADVVRERNSEGRVNLLILGQHLVTDEDPWTQIFKKLNIGCKVDEFLGAIDSMAEITGERFIIFIDALNEGRGKYFWPDNIRSFIKKINKYEWLGLVISIRTSYKELIFPKNQLPEELAIQHTHYGFRGVEYEAVKLFFETYKIDLPNVPLLHPEFQKPLFLKLFCDGLSKSGNSKIPDGLQGITSIIDFYIQSVNSTLSKPNRLNYPESINVVRKAISRL